MSAGSPSSNPYTGMSALPEIRIKKISSVASTTAPVTIDYKIVVTNNKGAGDLFKGILTDTLRNPLGAISHAGQLLSESSSLAREDRRLTSIIEEHSHRVNHIIENVMNLSKRKQTEPVTLELGSWLTEFKREYHSHHNLTN